MMKMSKGKAFAGAVCGVILFFIFGAMVDSMREDYRYLWDEDYRTQIEVVEVCQYGVLVLSLVELGYGIFVANVTNKQQDNPNLMECPDCNQMVSIRAVQCPHCGRNMTKTTSQSHNEQLLASGGWKCTCGRVQASYVSTCTCGMNKRDVLYGKNKI